MKKLSPECRTIREALLDEQIAGSGEDRMSASSRAHLGGCPACARYFQAILLTSRPEPRSPLYTPYLRRRTLVAIRETRHRLPVWLTPLLVPAAAVSLVLSIAVPVWLLSDLLLPFFRSGWTSVGIALAVSSSTGLAAAGAGLGLLTHLRHRGISSSSSDYFYREANHG